MDTRPIIKKLLMHLKNDDLVKSFPLKAFRNRKDSLRYAWSKNSYTLWTHTHTHMHTAQSPQEPILRLHKITDMEQIEILYLMSLFSKSVALKHCLRHVLTF
jgi:hypothetical protein